jgi:uncharacterized glyoxalase superfamily protein PhnB
MLIPCVQYSDAPAAIEFLCRAFGFTRGLVVPGPDNDIAHAELWHEGACLMLGTRREGDFMLSAPKAGVLETHGIYVVVEDTAAHRERALGAGAVEERPLTKTDYGSVDYSVRDPEGYLWNFGSYRPDPAAVA